jgi:hypothetical protein
LPERGATIVLRVGPDLAALCPDFGLKARLPRQFVEQLERCG